MNFQESEIGWGGYGPTDIVTNADGSMLLAVTGLLVSYDFGESWGEFEEQPADRNFCNLAISSSGDKIVAAALPAGDKAATLFVSSDYGCTWAMSSSTYFTENDSTLLASSADGNIVMAATGTNHFNCSHSRNISI